MATDRDRDDDEATDVDGIKALIRHYRLHAEAAIYRINAGEAELIHGQGQATVQPFQAHGQGWVSPPGIPSEEAFGTPGVLVDPAYPEILLQAEVVDLGAKKSEG